MGENQLFCDEAKCSVLVIPPGDHSTLSVTGIGWQKIFFPQTCYRLQNSFPLKIPGHDFSAEEITISKVICGRQGANNVWLL